MRICRPCRGLSRFIFLTALFFGSVNCHLFAQAAGTGYILEKPEKAGVYNYSGDNQYQQLGLKTEKALRFRVVDSLSGPVPGIPVYLKVISSPGYSSGYSFAANPVYTDSLGEAGVFFQVGNKEGEYVISAEIRGDHSDPVRIYRVYGRKSNWVFFLVIGLAGGLGLFLLGLSMMSDGLEQAAGKGLRSVLSSITANRFVAVGVGAFVTMVIQSSSATTVMLVSFVQSGLMSFAQTLGIILGADIGTTITAQLIAFRLTEYSLLLVALGFILDFFFKKERIRQIGKAILGFGILFFGMHIMSESMYPLRSFEPFIQALLKLENPLLGILAGMIFTALIQSSSAFIGILIVLATQGLLSLQASVPLLLGANIGTAVTAVLASINTDTEARKVALAHTLFKLIGVLAIVWWIPDFADLIQRISPKGSEGLTGMSLLAETVPRQIANAHTLFNVALTLLALPFTKLFARTIDYLIPVRISEEELLLKPVHLDYSVIGTAPLALSLAKQEVIRMSHTIQEMVDDILLVFLTREACLLEQIDLYERKTDKLSTEILNYITRVMSGDVSEDTVNEVFQIMYTVKEFEQIGDIVSRNLGRKAREWILQQREFSPAGKKEIILYHQKVQKQFSRAVEVFRDINLEKAKAMKGKYKEYRSMAYELEKQHYLRLKDQVRESLESSEYHLELIDMLQMISRHATNIARILLQWRKEGPGSL